MPSANLPTESERNQAATAGKAQVQSEAERGEKKQSREKTAALADEDSGSNRCVCFVYLTASLQDLIKQ